MIDVDVQKLIEWVGAEAAVVALDKSFHSNADLMMLARSQGIEVQRKSARKQIVVEIVMSDQKRISKTPEELLSMSRDELSRYFLDILVSEREIRSLLLDLGLSTKGKIRGKITEFAAREISELGVYERVSKGR